MKLSELLNPNAIEINIKSQDKEGIISELVDLLVVSGGVKNADKQQVVKKLMEREDLGSTGIGKNVGIPHAKCPVVKKMVSAIGISKEDIDFKSLDGEPTHIFFLLIAPGDNPGPHLKALAKISRLLDDKFIRERLRSASTPQEIVKIIKAEELKEN